MKTSSRKIDWLTSGLVFFGLGMLLGWMVFGSGGLVDDHHDAEPAKHGSSGPQILPQTLKNMGVEVAELRTSDFVRYRDVPAQVTTTPFTELPIFAPFGGRVHTINVDLGMKVEPGTSILTLVRDPIPQPSLRLTEDILKPANEEVHQAVINLRMSDAEIQILETELKRIEKYTGSGDDELPVLPTKTLIDLRYDLNRAMKSRELSQIELEKHGFSVEQIRKVSGGEPLPRLDVSIWRRALERNGLWPQEAQSLFELLPSKTQGVLWTIASVGELSAAGLNTEELRSWLKSDAEAGSHILGLTTLLQEGHSVEDLQLLHEFGAFEPIVNVQVPTQMKGADFDVHEILVKKGARVSAGDPLVVLFDPRELFLEVSPVGDEKGDILRAVQEQLSCAATPLVRGSGPSLDAVIISYVSSRDDQADTVAFAEISNEILTEKTDAAGHLHRSWKLRPTLKYTLRVPVETVKNAYVLPSSAVTEDGPDRVVFIKDGDDFKPVPVAILYQDHEIAVIAADSKTALFPGDRIVVRGAFELGLALKAGSSEVDAHAGHNH